LSVTPLHKELQLFTGTMEPKDLVARVRVPRFKGGDPDIIIYGTRHFKRSGHVDEKQEWKYIEAFVYAVPEVVDG
jgi:hypothetical protein